MKGLIPESINQFNIYKGVEDSGEKYLGITGEVSLFELNNITETFTGAGTLGEIETIAIGQFSAMEQEIPFRILSDETFEMGDPTKTHTFTLRAASQSTVKSFGNLEFQKMRIIFRGRPKNFKPGTMKQGGMMETSITLALNYVKIEIEEKECFELDKYNEVYKVNGVDLLKAIKAKC